MAEPPTPTILPPATPPQLLTYLLATQSYPLTLLIATPRPHFHLSLMTPLLTAPRNHSLLTPNLHQTATASHIRVLFTPTVSHLRAWLSAFSPGISRVPAPPGYTEEDLGGSPPWLVIYGLLDIHRGTSEWSGQGIMSTLSTFVDTGGRTGFRPVFVEPYVSFAKFKPAPEKEEQDDGHDEKPEEQQDTAHQPTISWSQLANEQIPLLGYKQSGDIRMSKRTVAISQITSRWFTYNAVPYSGDPPESTPSEPDNGPKAEEPQPNVDEYVSQQDIEAVLSQAEDMAINDDI